MKTVKSGPGIDHISDIIDIHKLEHESRRYLLFGFIIAIFFHGMLGVCIKFERVKVESEQVHSIPVKLLTIPEDIDQPLVIGRRQFHPRKLERKHSTSQTPDGHIDSRTHMPYGSGESFGTEDFGAEKYTSESLIPGEGEQPRPNGFGIENEGIAR
ncbi:MAG: hypothetical protein JXB48_07465, partial [Candidatus Latescibacteria bacterium]|nr:hypothetical protein [Candidatus Latescibacterota bacterium]